MARQGPIVHRVTRGSVRTTPRRPNCRQRRLVCCSPATTIALAPRVTACDAVSDLNPAALLGGGRSRHPNPESAGGHTDDPCLQLPRRQQRPTRFRSTGSEPLQGAGRYRKQHVTKPTYMSVSFDTTYRQLDPDSTDTPRGLTPRRSTVPEVYGPPRAPSACKRIAVGRHALSDVQKGGCPRTLRHRTIQSRCRGATFVHRDLTRCNDTPSAYVPAPGIGPLATGRAATERRAAYSGC